MTNFDRVDFFTDKSLIEDPFPYLEYLRSKGPVCRLPHRNVIAVTGYEEALTVVNDTTTFSSVNSTNGPIPDLPFVAQGSDITAQIEQFRSQMKGAGSIVTMDGAHHAKTRSLLMRLFVPSRLKENEAFMRRLSDRLIDEFVDRHRCELVEDYATPFATIVIADLLGVPEEDQRTFRSKLASAVPAAIDDEAGRKAAVEGFSFLFSYFGAYIADRRRAPRNDVMSELAAARFPDGSTPELMELVWVAAFLFGAGQDTTARLLAASMRVLAERPDLQTLLRTDRSRIPDFIEEVLRWEGPVKCASRLVRHATTLGGVKIDAGATVALFYGAINRDPRRFDSPAEFRLGRPKSREHLAFGRGAHTCAGAPLARTEVRVSLERLLDRISEFTLSEQMHGPRGERRFSYAPTYILRALDELHLELTSSSAAANA